MPRPTETIQAEEAASLKSPLRRSCRIVAVSSPAPSDAKPIRGRRLSASIENSEDSNDQSKGKRASSVTKETVDSKLEPVKTRSRKLSTSSESSVKDEDKAKTKSSQLVEEPETAKPLRSRRGSVNNEEETKTQHETDEISIKNTRKRRNSAQDDKDNETSQRSTRSRRSASRDLCEESEAKSSENKSENDKEFETKRVTRSRRSSTDTEETAIKQVRTPVKPKRRPSITDNAINLDPIDEKERESDSPRKSDVTLEKHTKIDDKSNELNTNLEAIHENAQGSGSPIVSDSHTSTKLTPIDGKTNELGGNLNLSIISEEVEHNITPRSSPRLSKHETPTKGKLKNEKLDQTNAEIEKINDIEKKLLVHSSEVSPSRISEDAHVRKSPRIQEKLQKCKSGEHVPNRKCACEDELTNSPSSRKKEKTEKSKSSYDEDNVFLPEVTIAITKKEIKTLISDGSDGSFQLNLSQSKLESTDNEADLNDSKNSDSSDKENVNLCQEKEAELSSSSCKKILEELTRKTEIPQQSFTVRRVSNVFRPKNIDYSYIEPMEVDTTVNLDISKNSHVKTEGDPGSETLDDTISVCFSNSDVEISEERAANECSLTEKSTKDNKQRLEQDFDTSTNIEEKSETCNSIFTESTIESRKSLDTFKSITDTALEGKELEMHSKPASISCDNTNIDQNLTEAIAMKDDLIKDETEKVLDLENKIQNKDYNTSEPIEISPTKYAIDTIESEDDRFSETKDMSEEYEFDVPSDTEKEFPIDMPNLAISTNSEVTLDRKDVLTENVDGNNIEEDIDIETCDNSESIQEEIRPTTKTNFEPNDDKNLLEDKVKSTGASSSHNAQEKSVIAENPIEESNNGYSSQQIKNTLSSDDVNEEKITKQQIGSKDGNTESFSTESFVADILSTDIQDCGKHLIKEISVEESDKLVEMESSFQDIIHDEDGCDEKNEDGPEEMNEITKNTPSEGFDLNNTQEIDSGKEKSEKMCHKVLKDKEVSEISNEDTKDKELGFGEGSQLADNSQKDISNINTEFGNEHIASASQPESTKNKLPLISQSTNKLNGMEIENKCYALVKETDDKTNNKDTADECVLQDEPTNISLTTAISETKKGSLSSQEESSGAHVTLEETSTPSKISRNETKNIRDEKTEKKSDDKLCVSDKTVQTLKNLKRTRHDKKTLLVQCEGAKKTLEEVIGIGILDNNEPLSKKSKKRAKLHMDKTRTDEENRTDTLPGKHLEEIIKNSPSSQPSKNKPDKKESRAEFSLREWFESNTDENAIAKKGVAQNLEVSKNKKKKIMDKGVPIDWIGLEETAKPKSSFYEGSLEEFATTKLDEYLQKKLNYDEEVSNESDYDDEDRNSFLDDMAEEEEESTPSEDSNAWIEEGEVINTDSERSEDDEQYDNGDDDSFICDEEDFALLSGEEYDLGDEKTEKKSRLLYDDDITIKKSKKKKSRIIKVDDSSEDETGATNIPTSKELAEDDNKKRKMFSEEQSIVNLNEESEISSETIQQDYNKKKSIKIIENIDVKEIKDAVLSEHIHQLVDTFCTTIPKQGDVSMNLSLEYKGEDSTSEKKKSKKRSRKRKRCSIEEVVIDKEPRSSVSLIEDGNEKSESRLCKSMEDIISTKKQKTKKSKKLNELVKKEVVDNERRSSVSLIEEGNEQAEEPERRLSKSMEDKILKKKRKTKKSKKNKELIKNEVESLTKKRPSRQDAHSSSNRGDLKHETFGLMNQLITDLKNRPKRSLKPSVTKVDDHNTSWVVELGVKVKPSTSAVTQQEKEEFKKQKFHPKDFRSQMLYDSSRVRRMETKDLLRKKGAYY